MSPTLKYSLDGGTTWFPVYGGQLQVGPKCSIWSSGVNQSNPGNSTVVSFAGGIVRYDTAGNMADLANSRILIQQPGYYVVSARLSWAINTVGNRGMLVGQWGSVQQWILDQYVMANASYTIQAATSEAVPLQAGDYLQLWANQGSGAALNLVGVNSRYQALSARWVSPL